MNYRSTLWYREQSYNQYGDIQQSLPEPWATTVVSLQPTVQPRIGNDVSAAFLTGTRALAVRVQPIWAWGFKVPAPSASPTSHHTAQELWRPLAPMVSKLPVRPHISRFLPALQGIIYSGQAPVWLNQPTSLLFSGKTTASPMRSQALPRMPSLGYYSLSTLGYCTEFPCIL